jgi:peptide-methionine (R)-S-oxide reductase
MGDMRDKPEEYWRAKLTPEQYRVMREKETEYPGTGKYIETDELGVYKCAACGQELFSSETKFGGSWMSGWPNFTDPVNKANVVLSADYSHGMARTAVACASCGGHLGHAFGYDVGQSGNRYCINSCSLDFEPKK